jgi:hypothetical protein
MKNLTKKELNQLKGGTGGNTDGDVKNNNTVAMCRCTYVDRGVTQNINGEATCECICIPPKD